MRFPEFTDEWKNVKLGDDCEIQMCRRVLAQQTSPTGDVPFFKIGTIGSFPDAYISKSLFDDLRQKYNYPRKGDILISCAGTVGRCVRFNGEPAYFQDSNIVWPKNSEKNYLNDFLYYILAKQTWRHLNTTTIVRIYNDDLRSLSFSCPPIEEQIKIVRLLSLLDERIATQNKIIEDLKKLKSAIYMTLFAPIKAENKSLGEIADIVKGKQINGEELSEQGKFYVMNGGIEPSGYLDAFNVQPNTISISEGGNSCGYVQWNNTAFWSGGHCYTLQNIKTSVSSKYLYHYLKWKEHEIMALRIGSGLPNIQKKDLAKVEVPIPPLKHQHQIEKIVNAIETKECTETELLQQLSSLKKYLLTKMFI